jgi:hypothetical protein
MQERALLWPKTKRCSRTSLLHTLLAELLVFPTPWAEVNPRAPENEERACAPLPFCEAESLAIALSVFTYASARMASRALSSIQQSRPREERARLSEATYIIMRTRENETETMDRLVTLSKFFSKRDTRLSPGYRRTYIPPLLRFVDAVEVK